MRAAFSVSPCSPGSRWRKGEEMRKKLHNPSLFSTKTTVEKPRPLLLASRANSDATDWSATSGERGGGK